MTESKDKLSLDSQTIRELANILNETDLSEIEYENNGKRIRVARTINMVASIPAAPQAYAPTAQQAPAPRPADEMTPQKGREEHNVNSPMVGTVYVSPSPDAPTFIKLGDTVTQGQTLLIIEAMKVMNPIKAPRAGKVTHIYVQDKQPVEFGEPLVCIE